jgi:hypothetical protein
MSVFQYSKMGDILLAIKDRLIECIPDATESTCKITHDPSYRITSSDIRCFNITPSPQSQVDQAAWDGGGNSQLTVRTRIIVTVFIPNSLDDPRESEYFHTSNNSIHAAKVDVLKALSFYNPINEQHNTRLLNDPISPAEWHFTKDKSSGDIQIAFDIEYDEDLDGNC